MGREKRRDENEWVEIKKEPHGITEFVIPLGLGPDQEKEEQQRNSPWISLRRFCILKRPPCSIWYTLT